MAIASSLSSFGANIPANSDLAAMNDYFYYTNAEHSAEGRANHTFQVGGLYTMSKECVWSSLTVASGIVDPIVMDLGGHKLIGTGCDSSFRPLTGHNNVTIVISNGTFETVYDPTTYPWTISPNKYTSCRGAIISYGNDTAHDSTLIIAKDGNLTVESGTDSSVTFQGVRHRVIVEDGGTLNAKLSFYGKDNRYIFKKGATFSKISNYISGGKFPQGIWYENGYTSNIIEVCSSSFLTAAGVTSLTPDAHAKKGSYHCGLSVSSPDFNWTGGGLTVGNQGGSTGGMIPVLFEMKEGAKYTSSGEFHIGNSIASGGSMAALDGEGTLWKTTNQWGGRVGSALGASNMVLRISNGAFFDVSGANFNVGYESNASHNAIQVLAGGRLATGTLNVGRHLNWGNSVLVSGEGSTMTNSYLQIGNTAKGGGGEHTVTADNNGSIYVSGVIYVGSRSCGSALVAKNGSKITVNDQIYLGKTEYKAESCSNRVEACDGGEIYIKNYISGYGDNSMVIARNGTISTRQIFVDNATNSVGQFTTPNLGTNNLIEVSGRYGFIESKSWTSNLKKGCKIRIVVPQNGFADRNEAARAPVKLAGMIADDSTSIELDVSAFLGSGSTAKSTPLLYCNSGVPDLVWNKMTRSGAGWSLERSADKKTLTLKRHYPLILEFY